MSPNERQKEVQSYQRERGAAIAAGNDQPVGQSSDVSNEYVLGIAFWTFFGFVFLEGFFAVIAGSQSMLEDAEAMFVDALTYLFNLWAERVKHRPYTEKELELPQAVREYRRELLRLYLELIPPLISVCTLITVTVFALRDAFETLNRPADDPDDDVSVNLMLVFSAANLLLDFVNVGCFARAHQAFGLTHIQKEHSIRYSLQAAEAQNLLTEAGGESSAKVTDSSDDDLFVNLNMCSAWTHVVADSLRSTAVLIAAGIAFFFSDYVSGALADSLAAVVVSIIILVSLIPLLHGLYFTARKIIALSTDPMRPVM